MNTKLLTALGCMVMIGAAMVPTAIAHTQGQNGALGAAWLGDAPPVTDAPSGWYYGSVSAYAAMDSDDLTPDNSAQCAALPPEAQEDCEALLSPLNPSFLLAAAFALCDMEVLGDGSTDPDQQAQDEPWVDNFDNTANGNTLPDGLFNDGGAGAVCHTPEDVSASFGYAQEGYYVNDDYNTGGCPDATAYAQDLVFEGQVWISASCDYQHTLNPPGALNVFIGCASDAVLTGPATDLTDCAQDLLSCISGTGCETLGASTECGGDSSADASGGFERGSTGVAYPSTELDTAGVDCAPYASAATFVWNAVDIVTNGGDVVDDSTASVATHGWVSAS